jgi:outer membrane protein
MKRSIAILLSLIAIGTMAQSKFGYVSYKEIVTALPEYCIVNAHLDELQAKYEAEIERSEREFNQKYTDFIEEQSQFPDNIRIKRHKELQELMEKAMAFKKEINDAMREARHEMMKPLHDKVNEAVMKVCIEGNYDYILDMDDRTYIAIDPQSGTDVTSLVKQELGMEQQEGYAE